MSNGIDDGCPEELAYNDCARFFFDGSHHITKEKFFQVCCRSWMERSTSNIVDGATLFTYEILWKKLSEIYVSGRSANYSSSVIRWILPDLPNVKFFELESNDSNDVNNGENHQTLLLSFWGELFTACEDGFSASCQEFGNEANNKRTAKRRRLDSDCFAPMSLKDRLRGRYKLPAVYIIVSLLKQMGVAKDWLALCDLAHELPSIFKTFTEDDVHTGLALVGLTDIGAGKPLAELSAYTLFMTYFSGIDSYGPRVFLALHEATSLNPYSLRASICRQVLDYLETNDIELSEDYKSSIIDACAICIEQENPERFIDDIEQRQQQLCKKRQQRKNITLKKLSIPNFFTSSGFPLLVYIQICLHKHQVERAAQVTRKIDSSLCFNDQVRDDAWFNIWSYLLAEGKLFLDGNLYTPGYNRKREFLYNYMACRVSQMAKIAMIDFFQEVANRVCEHEDSSLEEKQYVILACQQTVLRLLLKISGLSSNTILEFVQATKWPTEIPGQNSAEDLNVWSNDLLLRKGKVPSTLIDETTGLVNVLKRTTFGVVQVHSTLKRAKGRLSSAFIKSVATEESCRVNESLSNPDELSAPVDYNGCFGSNDEEESVNDHDSHAKAIAVDKDDSDELINEDGAIREEEGCDSDYQDFDEDSRYSNDDTTSDAGRVIDSDSDENSGHKVDCEAYQDEEVQTLHADQVKNSHVEENTMVSDNIGGYGHWNNQEQINPMVGYRDEIDSDNQREDDRSKLNIDATKADRNIGAESTITKSKPISESYGNGNSNISEEVEMLKTNKNNNRVAGVDVYRNTSDSEASNETNSGQNNASPIDTEKGHLSEFPLSFERSNNCSDSENNLVCVDDVIDSNRNHLQNAHKVRTEVAALGGEFGDTTEEEDGNNRFEENRASQADCRVDVLRSGIGYESQYEDGYEPEDTHGYTEEEVSEAIHTEDEGDEHIVTKNPPISNIDPLRQQGGHLSHFDKGEVARLQSADSRMITENTGRQNSIEPTSDDMDMADERTEQEEDVTAEFSELEENPECSFESPKASFGLTEAKNLEFFAQKAQYKENWGRLNETESISEDVSSKKNIQEIGKTNDELFLQKKEGKKTGTLSCDADDKKYATEGCKSIETEVEEDAKKDGIFSHQGISAINNDNMDGTYDSKEIQANTDYVGNVQGHTKNKSLNDEQELKIFARDCRNADIGNNEIFYPNKDSGNIYKHPIESISDTRKEQMQLCERVPIDTLSEDKVVSQVGKTNYEVQGTGNKNRLVGKHEANAEALNNEQSEHTSCVDEIGLCDIKEVFPGKGYTRSRKKDDRITTDSTRNNKHSDEAHATENGNNFDVSINSKSSSVVEIEEATLRGQDFSLQIDHINNDYAQNTLKEKIPFVREVCGINIDDTASEDYDETLVVDDKSAVEKDDSEKPKGDAFHFITEEGLGASKAGCTEEYINQANEGSISTDAVCNESKPTLSSEAASSVVDNPQATVPAEEIRKKDENVTASGIRRENETTNSVDFYQWKKDNSDDSASSSNFQSGGLQVDENNTNGLGVTGEDFRSDAESVDNETRCIDHDTDAVVRIEPSTAENEHDTIGISNTETKNTQDTRLEPNRDCIHSYAAETNLFMNHTRSEYALEANNSGDDEPYDIPQFIGVDSEKGPSKPTFRSSREERRQRIDDDTSVSSRSNKRMQKQESARSNELISLNLKKIEDRNSSVDESVENFDGGSVISENFRTYDPKLKASSTENVTSEALQKTGKDEKLINSTEECNVKSEILVTSSEHVDESTTNVIIASSTRPGSENAKGKDSAKHAFKICKAQGGGLPPRAPQTSTTEVKGRITRSRKKIDDEPSTKAITSTRSTASATSKLSSSVKVSYQKLKETKSDFVLVQTITSTKSTRSATRDPSSSAIAQNQLKKPPNEDNDDRNGDDASVQTLTSIRSTRSVTRKMYRGTRAQKQKFEGAPKDGDSDNMSAQTITSTRSTRSITRKLSTAARSQKQLVRMAANDVATNDQMIKSSRTTRSATGKLSSGTRASKRKVRDAPKEDSDSASAETITSTRSTRSITATGRLSSSLRTLQHDIQVASNDDGDDVSVQTTKSTRSTRSASRKLSSIARASKQKIKDASNDNNSSFLASTRSTRSTNRKLSSDTLRNTGKETREEIDSYSCWTVQNLKLELRKREIPFHKKLRKRELIEKIESDDKTNNDRFRSMEKE